MFCINSTHFVVKPNGKGLTVTVRDVEPASEWISPEKEYKVSSTLFKLLKFTKKQFKKDM